MEKAEDIANSYKAGKAEPARLVREHIRRIKIVNQEINAFITILEARAIASAEECSARLEAIFTANGIACQPVAVKDIFYIKGVRCTVGSKILKDFVPNFTSTVIKRLERRGAIILGTTNLHEFASGVTTVNPHFGATRNPWNKQKIAGGSSGGSAAAVSAGLVPVALGTDTSGSIRIPAALCGVFGLKPTYGIVSKHGVFPLSKSLDHVGPIASSSWGVAATLEAVAGFDPMDPASIRMKKRRIDAITSLKLDIQAKKAFIPDSLFKLPLHQDIKEGFQRFMSDLIELGLEVEHVEAEYFSSVRDIWAPIRFGEALAYHYEWYKYRPYDYGSDVLERLKAGEKYSAVDYLRAREMREEVRKMADKELGDNAVFITPTVSVPAPSIGESSMILQGKEYDVYQLLSNFTLPFNITGQPAISLPAYLSRDKLPIGMQIAAKTLRDDIVLNLSSKYERIYGVNKRV